MEKPWMCLCRSGEQFSPDKLVCIFLGSLSKTVSSLLSKVISNTYGRVEHSNKNTQHNLERQKRVYEKSRDQSRSGQDLSFSKTDIVQLFKDSPKVLLWELNCVDIFMPNEVTNSVRIERGDIRRWKFDINRTLENIPTTLELFESLDLFLSRLLDQILHMTNFITTCIYLPNPLRDQKINSKRYYSVRASSQFLHLQLSPKTAHSERSKWHILHLVKCLRLQRVI